MRELYRKAISVATINGTEIKPKISRAYINKTKKRIQQLIADKNKNIMPEWLQPGSVFFKETLPDQY